MPEGITLIRLFGRVHIGMMVLRLHLLGLQAILDPSADVKSAVPALINTYAHELVAVLLISDQSAQVKELAELLGEPCCVNAAISCLIDHFVKQGIWAAGRTVAHLSYVVRIAGCSVRSCQTQLGELLLITASCLTAH